MSSFLMSGFATNTSRHILQSLDHFNACVSPAEAISIDELLISPTTQKMLSTKIENKQFQLLFDASSIPNRARLMSASSNLGFYLYPPQVLTSTLTQLNSKQP